MRIKGAVYTATAGLLATCVWTATASAQNFMVYEYGASAGAVSQVSIANLAPNWVVTGVRNGSGDAEVITWESTGHALIRQGSATLTANGIDDAGVSIAALTPNLVVTSAVHAGVLQLASWSISTTGAVKLAGSWLFGSVDSARIAKLDSGSFIVADEWSPSNGGTLTSIITFKINSSGAIVFEGASNITYGTMVAATATSSSQFVTAIRDTAGDLQLYSWAINAAGVVSLQAIASAGSVSQLDIAAWDAGHVATPVVNGSGKLEVIDWAVNPSTGAITRVSSATAGTASQVAASTIGPLIFTASVNSGGKVDAGVWGYNGVQLTAGATAQDEAATLISAAPLSTGLYSVTATRTSSGDLQLDVWSGDYVP